MNPNTYPSFTPPVDYGVDNEDPRFFKSFGIDEKEEFLRFFDKCGFVVIRNVISDQDCDKTVDEIWELLAEITAHRIQRNDPNTWGDWPTNKTGILGVPIANDAMAWKNRQSKNIHRVFSQLYGDDDLISNVDRYNIMRPTKSIDFGINGIKDRDDWKGLLSWFHWDMNPWYWTGISEDTRETRRDYEEHGLLFSHNLRKLLTEGNDVPKRNENSKKLQGLVALDDTSFDTGGFQCVPGFVGDVLKQWALDNFEESKIYEGKHFVGVPKTDKLIDSAQVIGIPKGGLLVWSSELPHCNRLNESKEFRYCQYIKMVPASDIDDLPGRAKVVANSLTHGFLNTANVSPMLGLQYRYHHENRRRVIANSLLFALLVVLLSILVMLFR